MHLAINANIRRICTRKEWFCWGI